MRANLTPDIDLAARLFVTLRERSFDGVGVTREAYGRGERIAHEIVRSEAEALGLETRTDPAGNLLMTLPGADRTAKRVVLGSHLDSVPQGGNYDGAAGVLAGLAAVAGMKRAGFTPARDVIVLANRAEEGGAWFPTGLPGSRAAVGRLPPEALAIRRLDSGRTLEDHMREEGFDPDGVRVGRCLLPPESLAAYVELHIEQGPVLDAEKIPVGIVTGLPGSRRWRAARVVGEYNHSGATPRRFRRDAAIALAELAHRLDEHWALLDARGQRLVCTFCVLATTAEAGFTKVPGEAAFQLDIRSVDPSALDAMQAELNRLVAQIEARRGVRFELGTGMASPPTPMDPAVRGGLVRAAVELDVEHIVMASGGGHDAGSFAQAGVPAGMVFVRNQNGSHNPHEAMRMEDFALAASVLTRWAAEMAA
ncbi:hydantoinase/carbamoylase family amidase [Limobrevibacterium gyesilva]|uniref:Hydantoinase/carbamoylase family amidase n=1 Tax=Limobrevibacterium gyesilva TaxID=2991712 RepID=A0AA41YLY3_9PROT|nr:hydantoinase/carbamoylase family amidase [Limobrevibacterium gyesilva]MCW3474388.1 hydantoinase/carbamoylase family amidase [Limobrevibacterium gyesilva]